MLYGAQGGGYAPWRQSQQLGGLVDVHLAGAVALDPGEQRGERAECAVLGLDAVAGPGGDHPAHQPLEGGAGLLEQGGEADGVGGVGVLTPLEGDDAGVDAGVEEEGDRGAGGLAAGAVAIEAEHGRLGEAAEEGDLLGGEGRAERGDGLAVAALVHHDDVDVALDDDGSLGAAHGLAGEVEAEQGLAFGVEQGLGGVGVLGRLAAVGVLGVLREDAAGEGDDGAAGLYDGEHQAAAELVIEVVGALGAGDEAEFFGEGEAEAFALEVAGEAVPAGLGGRGGIAELEGLGGLGGDAAFLLVEAAELALFAGEEDLAVELGGGAGDRVGLVALDLLGVAGGVLEAGGELDAVELGQLAGGLEEALALELHDEVDAAAPHAAAEALVAAPFGVDIEAGGALAVEGTAGGEILARALEADVAADQIDDVDPILELLKFFLRDNGHGRGEAAQSRTSPSRRRGAVS